MLRLRPSELTLTPEDVEETFRRIARRQAARNTAQVTPREGQLTGRPVLRRGPQRAVRDAITNLGDIPMLRPQPQQAEVICTSEDVDIVPQQQTPSRERQSISYDTPTGQISRPTPTTTSTLRRLHLPFRIGRHRRDSVTNPASDEDDAQGGNDNTGNTSDHVETRTDGTLDRASHQKTPSASRRRLSLRSPAELRGGGGSLRKRERSSTASSEHRRRTSRAPGLRSWEQPSTPEPVTETSFLATAPAGSLYLRGRFRDPVGDPPGNLYTFDTFQIAPLTEPRPTSRRRTMFTRSLSSGSAPRNALHVSRTRPSTAAAEDPFSFDRPHVAAGGRSRRESLRGQHVGSETSNATDPFSIYELPSESRNPSGGNNTSVIPTYDGSSQYAVGGGYRSMYASNVDTQARPYTYQELNAMYSWNPLNQPSQVYNPPPGVGSTDAATAAIQNLPSPLQLISDHHQRLHYERLHYPTAPAPLQHSFPGPIWPPPPANPRNIATNNARSGPGYSSPYRGTFSVSSQPPPSQSNGTTSAFSRPYRPTDRAAQRSSENAPVSSDPVRSRPHAGQVQLHRQAYERMHNAQHQLERMHGSAPEQVEAAMLRPTQHTPGTFSSPMDASTQGTTIPSRHSPRDISNRRRPMNAPTPTPALDSLRSHGEALIDVDGRLRTRPRPSRRSSNGQVPSDITQGAPEFPVPPPGLFGPIPEPARRQANRISAPARMPTNTRTQRRMPPQQWNQENSGAAEEQMVRQEEGAIEARYGEGGGETMDETPPPVGRVERRMRDGDLL